MKLAVVCRAVVVLAIAALLVGCGDDPFEGTWRSNTQSASLVLSRLLGSENEYIATLIMDMPLQMRSLVRRFASPVHPRDSHTSAW